MLNFEHFKKFLCFVLVQNMVNPPMDIQGGGVGIKGAGIQGMSYYIF